MATLMRFPGIERTSLEFRAELLRVADRLSLDANKIAAVISLESGFDPANWNDFCEAEARAGKRKLESCAIGLIQFMPDTARRLGTTSLALSRMGDAEQLEFVEAFFRPFAGRLRTPGDYYMAVFNPAHVGKPTTFVLYEQGSKGYEQNHGLDRDKDGRITVGDVTQSIESRYAAGASREPLEVDETIPLGGAAPVVSDGSSCPSSSGSSSSGEG
jgi:hypothetical protein